jgi:hypothetical protein
MSDTGESPRYGAAGASIDMDSLPCGSEGGGGGGTAGDRLLLGAVARPGSGGSAPPGVPAKCGGGCGIVGVACEGPAASCAVLAVSGRCGEEGCLGGSEWGWGWGRGGERGVGRSYLSRSLAPAPGALRPGGYRPSGRPYTSLGNTIINTTRFHAHVEVQSQLCNLPEQKDVKL